LNNNKTHFFAALKGISALDTNIEALSVQLYNMSSFPTSIKLFTKSLNVEKKTNLAKLPLGTLTKRVAWLKKVCKIKKQILV
jgi:hypothetical protein